MSIITKLKTNQPTNPINFSSYSNEEISNLIDNQKLSVSSFIGKDIERETIKLIDSVFLNTDNALLKVFIYKQTITFKNDITKINVYAQPVVHNEMISDFFKNNF